MGEKLRKAVAVRRLPLVLAVEVAALEGDVVADAFVRLVFPHRDLAAVDADFVDGAFFGFGGFLRGSVRHWSFPFLQGRLDCQPCEIRALWDRPGCIPQGDRNAREGVLALAATGDGFTAGFTIERLRSIG